MSRFEIWMRAMGRAVAAFNASGRRGMRREDVLAQKVERASWTLAGGIAGFAIAAFMFGATAVPIVFLFPIPSALAGFYYGGRIGKWIGWMKTR